MINVNRRLALLGGVGAASLLVPRRAEANTPFANFAFPATGAPTSRTMPTRLAEIKNVKDFGAVGDGSTDDTVAIQAAVNWTSGANRGTIYFPLSTYLVTAPITFNYSGNLSICFRGEIGTAINATFSGYVFDRHLPTATVTISNASPGVVTDTAHGKSANDPVRYEVTVRGGLPAPLNAGTTYYVKTVLSANTYTLSTTAGGTVIATTTAGSGTITRAPINTGGGRIFEKLSITNGHAAGGCIRLGSTNGGAIRDCGFNAGLIAITAEDAVGVSSQNILFENCIFGGGAAPGAHYIIIGGSGAIRGSYLSGADTGVRAYGKGLFISGNRSERCGTSFLFGLDSGDNPVGASGFSLTSTSTEGCWTAFDLGGAGGGLCEGFLIVSSSSFAHAANNSGPIPDIQGGQYGLRIRADCARGGVIQATSFSGSYDIGGTVIGDATARANLVFRENDSVNTGGLGVNWVFPGNAYTGLFINNNELPTWTYSQRPTGGNVLEGDELNITDSNTATWGATVAGGGSNHILMRYNGTNWTVVGK